MQDRDYMELALREAAKAAGYTSPNPLVGCVIVSPKGEIVGTGYHHKAGEAHAEVNALAVAGAAAKGATAYVTLEPCSHYGRTGPCCRALAAAGIKKVVAAMVDPNPKVAGQGFAYLRERGIETEVGLCAEEAAKQNEIFLTWIEKGRPFISLKYAMTLDGKLAAAGGDSKWITGAEARSFAHKLRHLHDAVLVGAGTVLADDPQLTCRLFEGKDPLRIVLDSRLRTPLHAKVLNGEAPTLLVCSPAAAAAKGSAYLRLPQVELLPLEERDGRLPLPKLLEILGQRCCTSLLVEGGSEVLGSFFDAGLVDRCWAFIAPKLCGGSEALSPLGGRGARLMKEARLLYDAETKKLGPDLLVTGRIIQGKAGEEACSQG